jgi:hypothetical protein
VAAGGKSTECYLGLLYAMEDVAVYGYITPLKVKIVIALALSDSVVRDAEVNLVGGLVWVSAVEANPALDIQSSSYGVLLGDIQPIFETRRSYRRDERPFPIFACRPFKLEESPSACGRNLTGSQQSLVKHIMLCWFSSLATHSSPYETCGGHFGE